MAVTAHVYPKAQEALMKGTIDLDSDTLKVMLLSSYTYANSHATMSDVKGAGTETSGTGYTAGGPTLASLTVATSGDVTTLDIGDPSLTSSSIAAAAAVFYDSSGGTDATNIPVVHWDFGETKTSSSGTFTLTINASGLITATANA